MAVTWQDIVVSLVLKSSALYVTLRLAGHRVRSLYVKINVQK
jgi:hypothetical protein